MPNPVCVHSSLQQTLLLQIMSLNPIRALAVKDEYMTERGRAHYAQTDKNGDVFINRNLAMSRDSVPNFLDHVPGVKDGKRPFLRFHLSQKGWSDYGQAMIQFGNSYFPRERFCAYFTLEGGKEVKDGNSQNGEGGKLQMYVNGGGDVVQLMASANLETGKGTIALCAKLPQFTADGKRNDNASFERGFLLMDFFIKDFSNKSICFLNPRNDEEEATEEERKAKNLIICYAPTRDGTRQYHQLRGVAEKVGEVAAQLRNQAARRR